MEQTDAMSRSNSIHEQKHTTEMIVRGFEYFAKSRNFYKLFRNDYELLSISTLAILTSEVSNIEDSSFVRSVFQSLNDGQKNCILLIDEVYVKPILSFHSGQLFGKSVSDNTQLAKTVLAFMIVFYTLFISWTKVFGKDDSKLDTDFLYDQSKMLFDQIKDSAGNLLATICDNNRVNQAFFKRFPCISS